MLISALLILIVFWQLFGVSYVCFLPFGLLCFFFGGLSGFQFRIKGKKILTVFLLVTAGPFQLLHLACSSAYACLLLQVISFLLGFASPCSGFFIYSYSCCYGLLLCSLQPLPPYLSYCYACSVPLHAMFAFFLHA